VPVRSINGKAGHDNMEIADETLASRVLIRLVFSSPFKVSNKVKFLSHANSDDTQASWIMTNATPFIGKIAHVFSTWAA
jgi:hypothetical protein